MNPSPSEAMRACASSGRTATIAKTIPATIPSTTQVRSERRFLAVNSKSSQSAMPIATTRTTPPRADGRIATRTGATLRIDAWYERRSGDRPAPSRHHRRVRRPPVLVPLLAILVSCGGVGRVAEPEVVPVPRVRGTPAPVDAAAKWLLASSRELVAIADGGSLEIHAAPGTQRPYLHLGSSNPW